MKPQLLITTSTLPNDEHDAEPRFILDLAIALTRHFEVCVLAPRNPWSPRVSGHDNVEIRRFAYAPRAWEQLTYPGATLERLRQAPVRWGLAPLLVAGLFREIQRLSAERTFACVHAHWLVPQAAVQSLGSSRLPYIAIAHGSDVNALQTPLVSPVLRNAIQLASGVIASSRALIATLQTKFPNQMAGRPATVIGTGVDLEKFSPSLRSNIWEPHGLPRPILLYVGRLSEKKGVQVLLTAMGMEPLRSLRPSLVIIGEGPSRERLISLSEKLGLSDRVRFLPPCNHKDLGRRMASADILCVPSVDREGRPTVLVEAAACGVPSVAFDIGGIEDWINDGYNGILIPEIAPSSLACSLAGLLKQPARMRQMGQRGRKKAVGVSWPTVADRYAEFTLAAIDATKRTS